MESLRAATVIAHPDSSASRGRWILAAIALLLLALTFRPVVEGDGVGYYTYLHAAFVSHSLDFANEYAADGIRVNTICIGLVRSAQIDRRAKDGDLEAHYAGLAKRVPLGRVAHAREFGDLVAFLVSARASYITGTAINFDGGMSAVV